MRARNLVLAAMATETSQHHGSNQRTLTYQHNLDVWRDVKRISQSPRCKLVHGFVDVAL